MLLAQVAARGPPTRPGARPRIAPAPALTARRRRRTRRRPGARRSPPQFAGPGRCRPQFPAPGRAAGRAPGGVTALRPGAAALQRLVNASGAAPGLPQQEGGRGRQAAVPARPRAAPWSPARGTGTAVPHPAPGRAMPLACSGRSARLCRRQRAALPSVRWRGAALTSPVGPGAHACPAGRRGGASRQRGLVPAASPRAQRPGPGKWLVDWGKGDLPRHMLHGAG